MKYAAVLCLCLPLAGCEDAAGEPHARHPSWRRLRVVVADRETPRVAVFDAEDEEIIERLDLAGVVRPLATQSGHHAVLLGEAAARFLSAGVAIVDHGDHLHVYKSPPRLLTFELPGAIETALAHDGWLAFSAADGLRAFEESALASEPTMVSLPPAAADALVVPLAGRFVVAEGGEAARVVLRDAAGAELQVLGTCASPGTPLIAGLHVVLSCADGLLAIDQDAADQVVARKLAYAGGVARPKALRGYRGHRTVVGRLAGGELLRLDTASGAMETVALDAPVCAVEMEPGDGKSWIALRADGRLEQRGLDGDARAEVQALPAFSCDADGPGMAVAPERAYVSDPAAGQLVDVDLAAGEIAARHDVGGSPGPLTIVGLDEANLNVGPCGNPCIEN